VALDTINSVPEIERGSVFAMGDLVYESLCRGGRYDDIIQIFEALEQRWPEAYEKEQGYFGHWRVQLALAGHAGTLEQAVAKLAPGVGQVSDMFFSDIPASPHPDRCVIAGRP
jgi:hypothetical protein